MISMAFVRAPLGRPDESFANCQPLVGGEIDGEQLTLRVYGEEDFGLSELHDTVVAFEGQQTYDELRAHYLKKAGSVFARVTLQDVPNLSLEQTPDGWCVQKLGGAEYQHFDGLVDRLKAAGFDAKLITAKCVAVQIPQGEEFEAFRRLAPIITNTV